MPHFPVCQHAELHPTRCLTCQSHEGPFIDTGVDQLPIGHVYLCRLCILDAAGLFGGLHPADRERLESNLRTVETELMVVRQQLVEEAGSKFIDLATARMLLTPVPIPVAEKVEPQAGHLVGSAQAELAMATATKSQGRRRHGRQ